MREKEEEEEVDHEARFGKRQVVGMAQEEED